MHDEMEMADALAQLLLNHLFSRLPEKFTIEDFRKSYHRVFKKENNAVTGTSFLDTFAMALDFELIEELETEEEEEDKFSFLGFYIESPDLS